MHNVGRIHPLQRQCQIAHQILYLDQPADWQCHPIHNARSRQKNFQAEHNQKQQGMNLNWTNEMHTWGPINGSLEKKAATNVRGIYRAVIASCLFFFLLFNFTRNLIIILLIMILCNDLPSFIYSELTKKDQTSYWFWYLKWENKTEIKHLFQGF